MLTTTAPTAPATGQSTQPENITEDTQRIPKQNNKLGLSWWPSLPQNENQVSNAKSEVEVNSGISPADQVTKELSDLNSKIVKLEQNLSLLADKMVNMDSKIKFIEESTKKIDNMDTKINQVGEAIKQSDSMQTNLDQLANDFNHQSGNIKDLQEKVSSNTGEISKFMGLQEIVEYLEKEVENKSSADSNLVETLENRIKQDLMQEMGRLKTDITDKVDKIFTNLQQDMEGLAGKVESKIQTMDGVGTKFNSFIEKVKYLETDNLKAKVDNLDKNMKALAGKVEDKSSADSNLVETLENRIKQDLEANLIENAIKKFDNLEKIVRHQTDNYNLKTKVDTLDKNIKALAEKVENKSQTMDGIGTEPNSLVKKVTHMHQFLYGY